MDSTACPSSLLLVDLDLVCILFTICETGNCAYIFSNFSNTYGSLLLLVKERKVVKMYEKVSVRVEHGKYVACTFFPLVDE